MQSGAAPEVVFAVTVDPRTGGYVATDHAHGIIATGDTLQELRVNALDATDAHFAGEAAQPAAIRFLYQAGDLLME